MLKSIMGFQLLLVFLLPLSADAGLYTQCRDYGVLGQSHAKCQSIGRGYFQCRKFGWGQGHDKCVNAGPGYRDCRDYGWGQSHEKCVQAQNGYLTCREYGWLGQKHEDCLYAGSQYYECREYNWGQSHDTCISISISDAFSGSSEGLVGGATEGAEASE